MACRCLLHKCWTQVKKFENTEALDNFHWSRKISRQVQIKMLETGSFHVETHHGNHSNVKFEMQPTFSERVWTRPRIPRQPMPPPCSCSPYPSDLSHLTHHTLLAALDQWVPASVSPFHIYLPHLLLDLPPQKQQGYTKYSVELKYHSRTDNYEIQTTIVPLLLQPLLDDFFFPLFFHFVIINKEFLKFVQLMWEKKCQVILHYLGTLHHQALGQAVNSNVIQISRTFGIASSCFWEKSGFIDIIIARMVKVLQYIRLKLLNETSIATTVWKKNLLQRISHILLDTCIAMNCREFPRQHFEAEHDKWVQS